MQYASTCLLDQWSSTFGVDSCTLSLTSLILSLQPALQQVYCAPATMPNGCSLSLLVWPSDLMLACHISAAPCQASGLPVSAVEPFLQIWVSQRSSALLCGLQA